MSEVLLEQVHCPIIRYQSYAEICPLLQRLGLSYGQLAQEIDLPSTSTLTATAWRTTAVPTMPL